MIFTIEGNVSAGKTTLLEFLAKTKFNIPHIVCYEPVDDWLNFKMDTDEKSLFELFYQDPKKHAFSFQMMALQSRFEHIYKTINENKGKIIICERSFLTDAEIFAKLQYEEGNISDIDYHIYRKWHAFFLNILNPDIRGLIYLNTSPEECMKRISVRNRKGEEDFSKDYMDKLDIKHKNWLYHQEIAPVFEIDGNKDIGHIEILSKCIVEYINDATSQ